MSKKAVQHIGKIPATRPRNPFGRGTMMAKAGSHQKSEKAERRAAHTQLQGLGLDEFNHSEGGEHDLNDELPYESFEI